MTNLFTPIREAGRNLGGGVGARAATYDDGQTVALTIGEHFSLSLNRLQVRQLRNLLDETAEPGRHAHHWVQDPRGNGMGSICTVCGKTRDH